MVNEEPKAEEGKLKFRPNVRLLQILGNQLITDEVIAIVELVKNGYDADATDVKVVMNNVVGGSDAFIEVRDNGTGMNLSILRNTWMVPGRDNKKIPGEKDRRKLSPVFLRKSLGEKGVGRFSVDKLGYELQLVSRWCQMESETGKILEIAPKELVFTMKSPKEGEEGADKYLDEFECDYVLRDPVSFPEYQHGTELKITGLRSEWNKKMVGRVNLGLSRLISPFGNLSRFNVILESNEFPEFNGRMENPLLNLAPYNMKATVGKDGVMEFQTTILQKPESGKLDLRSFSKDRFRNLDGRKGFREPSCGGFKLNIFAFERGRGSAKKFGMDKEKLELLDSICGVSIFRDGFRVWPYGESGDDWLLSDKRRVQNPGVILGNDRVIGYIEISREGNNSLKDKTNREGLIEEGLAFQDFKDLVTIATDFLATKRSEAIPKKQRSEKKASEAQKSIETNKKEIEQSSKNIIKTIGNVQTMLSSGNTDEIHSQLLEVKNQAEKAVQAAGTIGEGTKVIVEELNFGAEQTQNLISMAGIGLTAERMTHEVVKAAGLSRGIQKKLVAKHGEVMLGPASLGNALNPSIEQVDIVIEAMRHLEPLYYSRRRVIEDVNVGELLVRMKAIFSNSLSEEMVNFDVEMIGTLVVKVNRGHLMQVFNNLIDNSLYWLNQDPNESEEKIKVIIDEKERKIVFSDSGPGVSPHVEDHLFEPFISMKKDGRGLGLYIVKDILDNYGAEISLIKEGCPLKGATFVIEFKGDK
jgi:hypothetical protein